MSLLILCLAVTIASAAIAGYCYQSHRQIMTAARTGRISTPEGVYYVVPSPTYDEVKQLRDDVATLNRQMNRRNNK